MVAATVVAFLASLGAGLSTSIGASLVFIPRLYSPIMLSCFLALAAGVMIYLSLIEIFPKSLESYAAIPSADSAEQQLLPDDEGFTSSYGEPLSFVLASATFFGGIVLTAVLDQVVHLLYHQAGVDHVHDHILPDEVVIGEKIKSSGSPKHPKDRDWKGFNLIMKARRRFNDGNETRHDSGMQKSDSHGKDTKDTTTVKNAESSNSNLHSPDSPSDSNDESGSRRRKPFLMQTSPSSSVGSAEEPLQSPTKSEPEVSHPKASLPVSVLTALAVTLHNLPEGLATFVSFLSSPASGIPLAVAIAIHNIPEGICVAIPIWLSTGSKWKGFIWGTISGLSEPLGALIGWALVGFGTVDDQPRHIDKLVYALLFGITGGMMMYVSFKELLPMAFRYDRGDRVSTWSLFAGMAIVALSLAIFKVAFPH